MTHTQTQLTHAYEEDEISLLDILVTLAESWKLLVFGPLVGGLLAGALSFLWPNTYESVAVLRLDEDEIALIHTAPVLTQLIAKFDLLKESDGIQEDARKDLIKNLIITVDKKTKLTTLAAKAKTPEQAQALASAALEATIQELRVKGKDKELIEKNITVNQQAIDIAQDAVDAIQKNLRKGTLADAQQESSLKNLAAIISDISKRAQENSVLAAKLVAHGEEVYVQKAHLPERKSGVKRSLVVMIGVLVSGFALFLWVFVRKAWLQAAKEVGSAEKIKQIKAAFSAIQIE